MWQKINENYYFKFNIGLNYELYTTNFVNIWSCIVIKDKFIKIVKESNEQLETSDDNLLNQVTDMLHKAEHAQCTCESVTEEVMHARIMKKSVEGYPVKLKFKLTIGSKQMFFQEVTKCLMSIIKDLNKGQNELFTILKKKDREIESYKLDGAILSLSRLKTPRFNEEEHLSRHPVFGQVFGSSQIPEDILQKNNENGFIYTNIKEEVLSQNAIKEEPISQESVIQPKASTSIVRENIKIEATIPNKKHKRLLNL